MAAFNVTITEIRNRADSLEQLNQQLDTEIGGLVDIEGSLNGMWEGDARKAFHTAFGNDITQMRTFHKAVTDYVTILRNTATEYERAEANNLETANQRNYG